MVVLPLFYGNEVWTVAKLIANVCREAIFVLCVSDNIVQYHTD